MRIGRIIGVERYAFVGTEMLNVAASAIKAAEVGGDDCDDHIAALFEFVGEECDLSISHKEFKAQFEKVIDLAINEDGDSDGSSDTDEGNENVNTDNVETQPDGSDGKGSSGDTDTESDGDTDAENDSDGEAETKSNDEESTNTDSNDSSEDSKKGADSTDEESNSGDKDAKSSDKKKFLSQRSLNHHCGNTVTLITEWLKQDLPPKRLEVVVVDDAIGKLTELKEYLTR